MITSATYRGSRRLLAGGVALALVAAACGDDDNGEVLDEASPTESAGPSGTAPPEAETTVAPSTTAPDEPSTEETATQEVGDTSAPAEETTDAGDLEVVPLANIVDDASPEATMPCDAEPVVRTNDNGVDFVRTPDSCFDDVEWPGIDYEPRYVEVDGLRVHYVEAGPADGPVVLMLHGEPTWSYLYHDMIAEFADQGYRAIAMDYPGMGRSDKPVNIEDYSYLGQTQQTADFIDALGLEDITLVVQDWGANIGLKLVGEQPDRFSAVVAANGAMPLFPDGLIPYPPVENPDEFRHGGVALLRRVARPARAVPRRGGQPADRPRLPRCVP